VPVAVPTPADTLLAFDTSTERMAVAVQTPCGRWVDDAEGGAAASAALLPAIRALLKRAGRRVEDVQAIGFGQGPGAFTGLRTSCAVAQGLAFGLERPVLPIDSLLLVAEQARQLQGAQAASFFEVAVAMDARMGELYAGRYRWSAGRWQTLQAPGLWTPAALAEAWTAMPPVAATGSGLALLGAGFEAACPPGLRIEAGPARAAALIALAAQAWADGAGLDAAQAVPLYLRDKVALTTAERAAAGATSAVPAP
jgi:tRNA threonylcarbamoyladenosine biosynthesis protein TsaB